MSKNRITDKRLKLLEEAGRNGGLTIEKGLKHYSFKQNVSESIQYLVEEGFLEERKAPENSDKRKVWFLTEKGNVLTQ